MPDDLQPTTSSTPESSAFSGTDDFTSFIPDPQQSQENQPQPANTAENAASDGVQPETPEDPAQQDGAAAEQEAPGISFKGVKPSVVALMKQYAKASDADLANPTLFNLIRQNAEKEVRIRDLTPASSAAKDYLDAFNDPEPGQQQGQQAASDGGGQQQVEPPPHIKIAQSWEKPEDFVKTLGDAYAMEDGPDRDKAIADNYRGFLDRSLMQVYMPMILRQVSEMLGQRIGPMEQQQQQLDGETMRRSVVETLAKNEDMGDIMQLFDNAGEGTLTAPDGVEVADTWLNRVLLEHPYILDIEYKGPAKSEAEKTRKTMARRYEVALKHMRAMRKTNIDPKVAGSLVETGKEIAKSKRDPVRTSLNAGNTGVPAGSQGDDLFGGNGGRMSLNRMFG